ANGNQSLNTVASWPSGLRPARTLAGSPRLTLTQLQRPEPSVLPVSRSDRNRVPARGVPPATTAGTLRADGDRRAVRDDRRDAHRARGDEGRRPDGAGAGRRGGGAPRRDPGRRLQ